MSDLEPLILDMLGWLAREPRTYTEAMDAWRTACPLLTVWEDAIDRGLIARQHRPGAACAITVTPAGLALLESRSVST
jgi:hypothetical protein